MTAKRFQIKLSHIGELMECETKTILATTDIAEELIPLCDLLNELHEENQELQERNDRQAKQLDNLYTLIEKQDWKTLTGLIQEFQECEEQLQKEWKCYE